MRLRLLAEWYAVCRMEPDAAVPVESLRGRFASVSRSPEELSVICATEHLPAGPARIEAGWRCLEVAGPLPFEMTGVAASLAGPLAAAGVPLLLTSTFDTDYLLVRSERLGDALAALRAAGHEVVDDA